jgi:hypothetical protein
MCTAAGISVSNDPVDQGQRLAGQRIRIGFRLHLPRQGLSLHTALPRSADLGSLHIARFLSLDTEERRDVDKW